MKRIALLALIFLITTVGFILISLQRTGNVTAASYCLTNITSPTNKPPTPPVNVDNGGDFFVRVTAGEEGGDYKILINDKDGQFLGTFWGDMPASGTKNVTINANKLDQDGDVKRENTTVKVRVEVWWGSTKVECTGPGGAKVFDVEIGTDSDPGIDPDPGAELDILFGELTKENTTLEYIQLTGLQPGKYYVLKSIAGFDRRYIEDESILGDKGGEIHTAESNGAFTLRNICENGEGERTDCTTPYPAETYTVRLYIYEFDGVLCCQNRIGDNPGEIGSALATRSFQVTEGGEIVDLGPVSVYQLEKGTNRPTNEVATKIAERFLNFAVGIAGGVAFLLMIFGAYRLIFAGGNPDSIQQGKEIITAAIAGLLVIVFSIFLLGLIGISILGLPI